MRVTIRRRWRPANAWTGNSCFELAAFVAANGKMGDGKRGLAVEKSRTSIRRWFQIHFVWRSRSTSPHLDRHGNHDLIGRPALFDEVRYLLENWIFFRFNQTYLVRDWNVADGESCYRFEYDVYSIYHVILIWPTLRWHQLRKEFYIAKVCRWYVP